VAGPLLGTWAYEHLGHRAPWIACLVLGPLIAICFLGLERRWNRTAPS
jgi:hypothetical protein